MSYTSQKHDLLIRDLRENDVQRVFDIHMKALALAMPDHYSKEQIAAWVHGITPAGYWRIANSGEKYRVAESDNIILGFASWQDHELLALFIEPNIQGSGVGSELHRFCNEESPIHFVKAMLGAVSFYRRHSFEVIEQRYDMKRGVQLPYVATQRP